VSSKYAAASPPASPVRARLCNRRFAESFALECSGLNYDATISRFDGGNLAEIFLNCTKNGTAADAAAKDAAVVCSIALQYGVPLDVISHALLRDPRGKASSPLGVALDMIGEAAP
jgi:hypothetical protein